MRPVDYTEPDIRLDLAMGTGDDPYEGLDRFDRVQDQRWYDYGASADAARIKHGYDRAGNRLWREDPVAATNSKNFDELYAYDGIYRLSDFKRGDLNSSKNGISTGTLNFEQDWGFDPLGNWTSFKEDAAGDGTFELDQTRTVNKVNEITGITGGSWTVPAYDRSGNMTTMPQPATPTSGYTATYDAWNRLVKLVDGANTVAEYQYDGQKWRTITKSYTGGSLTETRHHYYSSQWQAVEERVGASTNPNRQFVWGLRYIDDLVLRDRDTSTPADGTLDERLYALQDANWNVIALADTSGTIQERYIYSAYGQPTVLTGTFGSRSSSSYDWEIFSAGNRKDRTSSLYYVRYRDYHMTLGTFAERDLLEYIDGQNSNLAFLANPLRYLDPSGTACAECGEQIGPPCTARHAIYHYGIIVMRPWPYGVFDPKPRNPPPRYKKALGECTQGCQLTSAQNPAYVIITNGCTSSPDNPLGFDFKSCCDKHDICYQTCAAKKIACDKQFYLCLVGICLRSSGLSQSTCLGLAATYYQAVVAYGDEAYWSSQHAACLWVPCKLGPLRSRSNWPINESANGYCPYPCPTCPTGYPTRGGRHLAICPNWSLFCSIL